MLLLPISAQPPAQDTGGASLAGAPLGNVTPYREGVTAAPVGVIDVQGGSTAEQVASIAGRVGSIAGTVRLAAVPAEAPPRLSPYSTPRYRPQAAPPAPSTVEDVVVYVASARGAGPPARAPTTITQKDRRIIPRVTALQVGTEVRFPNQDDVFHNLFSLSDPKRFNLGRYPPGQSEAVVFDQPGTVRLFCDIHSEMWAVILVLETPFFTRPAADGSYQIANLPAGTHTVIAWHERAPTDTVVVMLGDGRVAQADFSLGGGTR